MKKTKRIKLLLVLISIFSFTTLSFGASLEYATYLGGAGNESVQSIAVDSAGCVYVIGNTSSSDYPTVVGSYTTSNAGSTDAFITKMSADGKSLVYSTYLGGSGYDTGNGIAVDSAGNAYVTGYTDSTNFPTTASVYKSTNSGLSDSYIAKINPLGNALVYSTYIGGNDNDYVRSIAIDMYGNAYIIGNTNSTNYPTTVGAFSTSNAGSIDGFVTKINPTGTSLVYSTYLGGSSDDYARNIYVDAAGYVYAAGYTSSMNYPVTGGAYTTSSPGNTDIFVTKINLTGTALVYSTYLGGNGYDYTRGITADTASNAIVAGYTDSSNFPTTEGVYSATKSGGLDVYLTKLNATGSSLVYSTFLGGSGDDYCQGVSLDSAGNAYLTGHTNSTNFPTTDGAFSSSNTGGTDSFIARINSDGTALVYSSYVGGSLNEPTRGIAVDPAGNAYITGYTTSTDFPVTAEAYSKSYSGSNDTFIVKFDNSSMVPVELSSFMSIE